MPPELFALGQLLITSGAKEELSQQDIERALRLHSIGFWGEVDDADKLANDEALKTGERLLSTFIAESGTRFWVITEADRSATTILLPDEY